MEEKFVDSSFLHGIFNALPFQMALLDGDGIIRMVNQKWKDFARENGLNSDQIGVNYLEITKQAADLDDSAKQVYELLVRACRGEQVFGVVEYPCHSPWEKRYFHVHINSFTHEGRVWVIVSHENVTAEVLNREKEQEAQQCFQELFRNMQEGVVLHEWIRDKNGEIVDYRIVGANESFARYTDLDVNTSLGMPATQLYGVSPPPYFDIYKRVYEKKQSEVFETYYAPMKKYFFISALPWGDGFATIFWDISPLKLKQQELELLVQQKQFLFRELQHRSKNTFATIAGLVGLMASEYTGEVYDALIRLREQIVAMAKVYEILYFRGEEETIDLANYIQAVVSGFRESFEQIFRLVDVNLSLESISLDAKRVNYVGLWLIEVLINAIKYVFVSGAQGMLSFSLTREGEDIVICYQDSGKYQHGSKNELPYVTSSGFGSEIMLMVVTELHGKQDILQGEGRSIILRFPYSQEEDGSRRVR